jgi:hypothetical protein
VLGQPAEVYSSETIRIEITAECLLCGRGEAGFMPCSPNLACLQIKFSTRSYKRTTYANIIKVGANSTQVIRAAKIENLLEKLLP